MNLEIRGIHYNVTDTTKEFFDKKLARIDFAKEYIVDLQINVHKEPHQSYKIEGKVHFQWGKMKIVHADGYELYEAIEYFVDKLERIVRKEKEKIKDHGTKVPEAEII
mgnify:CR=1 FL=1